mgnify:CR=1 FL=1
MGISLKDFASFAEGAIERDRELTKEDFEIRNANLAANRDFLIKQKEKKYDKELNDYYEEKEKFDSLKSAATEFANNDIDARTYASKYYIATMGDDFKLLPEKTRLSMINNFDGKTVPYTLKGNIDEINANAAKETLAINDATTAAIKEAKGDSFLINQILKKKGVDEKKLLEDIQSKVNAAETVELTEQSIDPEVVGLEVKTSGADGLYSNIDRTTNAYKKFAEKNFSSFEKLAKESSDYKSANNNLTIAKVAKELSIPNQKDYFVTDRDDNIIRFKNGGSEFAKTTSSNLKMFKDYTGTGQSTDALFILYNGDMNRLVKHYDKGNIDGLLANRIKDFGTAVTNGAVIGEGGDFSNVLRKETNLIIVPTGNSIDFDNSLKGTNVIFSEDSRRSVSNIYTNVLLNMATEVNKQGKSELNIQKLKDINNQLQNLEYGQQSSTLNRVNTLFLAELIDKNIITKDEALQNKVFNSAYNNSEEFKKQIDTLGTAKAEDNQGETNQGENNNVKGSTIKVTFSDGKTKILPNNEEVKKELEKDKENIISQEIVQKIKQDEKIIDNISSDTVVKKLVPNDFGIVNKPVFESLKEVREVLDIPMSGKEIKERYDINFPINDKTIFRPIN